MTVRQLILDLPKKAPDYRRDNFLVSRVNMDAVAAGERWLSSPDPSLCICGPAHSGKTHLAHMLFAAQSSLFLHADRFTDRHDASGIHIVDDMPAKSPKGLLQYLEELIGKGARVVLLGRGAPADWSGGLIDLKTRLEAMPRAVLGAPDDALIEAVMHKEFVRRQISVDRETISFCIARLPLSFDAAFTFIEAVDRRSLEEKRAVTKPLARKILEEAALGVRVDLS